jgi:hypothetical protein
MCTQDAHLLRIELDGCFQQHLKCKTIIDESIILRID